MTGVPDPERPSADPDARALVDRLAEAVAAAYVERVPDPRGLGRPVLGVLLWTYWDGSDVSHWGPPVYAVPEPGPGSPPGDELWEDLRTAIDLGLVSVDADPALREPGEALLARLEAEDDDPDDDLLDRYFNTLATRLAAAWDMPVAQFDGRMPEPAAQVRAQLGHETAAEWEARGWLSPAVRVPPAPEDALLAIPRADGTVAGIAANGVLTGDLRRPSGPPVGAYEVMADDYDVLVVGGVLPENAVGARVQDLYDVWQDATVSAGLWAAVLGHPKRGGMPPVRFFDQDSAPVAPPRDEDDPAPTAGFIPEAPDVVDAPEPGQTFTVVRDVSDADVLRGVRVPVLWDDALGANPRLGQVGGDGASTEAIELCGDRGNIQVVGDDQRLGDDAEREVRTLLEMLLSFCLGPRTAGRTVLEAIPRPLPATVEGRPETFLVVEGRGRWAAVFADPGTRIGVRVVGTGAAPARLDLRRWDALA